MGERPERTVARARRLASSGAPAARRFRRQALTALERLLTRRRTAWEEALAADLGAPAFEAWAAQTGVVLQEIRHARRRLRSWMRPERVRSPLALLPSRSRIEPAPMGVVLVIAPWNYPLQLSLAPAVAAIAAGNAVVVKPSEHAPATAALLAELVPAALPEGLVEVVPGGPEVGAALATSGSFDHIVFTGSRRVGARVAEAAGRTLTPVTLELGGKCPALIERTANLRVAARRIAWGKFLNAGQTCVAPDFVLVPSSHAERFHAELDRALDRFYGPDPARSPDYARIAHRAHFDRLVGLLDGLSVRRGGEFDPETRYFAPTVTGPWTDTHPAGREEIFGPILPVIPCDSLDEGIAMAGRLPTPLALHVFTRRRRIAERVAARVRSGAVLVNDAVVHCANPALPFGGAGASGYGAYHGVHGFDRLSQPRAWLTSSPWFDVPLRYPPYRGKLPILRRILR